MDSTISIRKPFAVSLTGDAMISASLFLFVFLYNLPITLILPGIIRKPLLLLGLAVFFAGCLMKSAKYALLFISAVTVEWLFFSYSWVVKQSLFAYMFPAAVSIEFFICALMILDGQLNIPKSFLQFFLWVTIITAATSVVGLLKYPTAIRTLGMVANYSNSYWQRLYRLQNIAGWGLLFGMAFFDGVLFYLYKKEKTVSLLVAFVINTICILLSQLMFAILLAGLLVFLVFVNSEKKSVWFMTAPFIALFAAFWIERARILAALYGVFQKFDLQMISLRIKNLYDLLVLHDTTGDAGSRFDLYSMSLHSFVENPFGRFFIGSSDVMEDIGFHSEFCDLLGTLGIFGLLAISIAFIIMLQRVCRIDSKTDRRYYISSCMIFILMFLINPIIPYPQIWLSTLLIPLLAIERARKQPLTTTQVPA